MGAPVAGESSGEGRTPTKTGSGCVSGPGDTDPRRSKVPQLIANKADWLLNRISAARSSGQ